MRRRIKKNPISVIRIIRGCSGFTLNELIVILMVICILIAIASFIYGNYISKARLTVAISTLSYAQKSLTSYNLDNNKYPDSIDFTSCVDEQGRTVFPSNLCDQMKDDLSAKNYVNSAPTYILTARANDKNQTLLTMTGYNITTQGN